MLHLWPVTIQVRTYMFDARDSAQHRHMLNVAGVLRAIHNLVPATRTKVYVSELPVGARMCSNRSPIA